MLLLLVRGAFTRSSFLISMCSESLLCMSPLVIPYPAGHHPYLSIHPLPLRASLMWSYCSVCFPSSWRSCHVSSLDCPPALSQVSLPRFRLGCPLGRLRSRLSFRTSCILVFRSSPAQFFSSSSSVTSFDREYIGRERRNRINVEDKAHNQCSC